MRVNAQEEILVRLEPTNQKLKPNISARNESPCCRICLEQMRQNQLFQPCECKGSNSHFHEQCLLQWIAKQKKYKDSFTTYFYICEICKGRIFLQTRTKFRCITGEQIKQELFDKYICCTLTTLIFLFCSLILMGIMLYVGSLAQTQVEVLVYAVGTSITVAVIIATIIVYTFNYVLKSEVITHGIDKDRKTQLKVNQRKISPQTNDANSFNQLDPTIASIQPTQ